MSLILEALKKSEQQRRLGEAPSLSSPVLSVRGGRSLLPLFGVLIVIAIAAGWWLLRPTPSAAPSAPSAKVTTAAGIDSSAPPMSRIKPTPAHAAMRPTPARAEPGQLNPRGREKIAAPLPITPPLDDRPGSVTQLPLPPKAVATPPPAHVETPPAAPVAAAPPASKMLAPAPASASVPNPTAAAPVPTAAAHLPLIWDLPYATRKDLPDLTLTMHMYAPSPQDRFVVIKGERHIEGDDLGDGVILREIRPDGMVLDYKGKRFMYPRAGG